ncbi:MAG: TRAP transporter substrate-binding protein DctP [Deltaproteobacteria bacterium]|nr:TRAP transporter substrate-binding protein DctP [Deltaproteobacteria bacterium]
MNKKILLSLVAVILMGSIVLAGWAPQAQAAKKPIKWRAQTMWVPSITLWRGDKYFVDLINVLAAGELEIKYNEGGTLVTSSKEMFDAVRHGTIDLGTDWPSYWEGKNTAFSLLTSVPMGFTPVDYLAWYWQGGGLELAQELYGKYGIVWFPHSVTSPEAGQRSNVPIRKGEDYKGVKMRQCGRNQARILKELGGAAIFMPGAEIYMALQRGTIDAGEFSVPECDWSMGFQEVTKYWVLPGWHQPGPVSGVMINKKSWNKLPDRIKFMFKEAAMATMMWAWTYFEYSSAEYTQKFIDAGITLTRLDNKTLDKIQELAYKFLLEDAEKNPDHAKVAFSQVKFFKDFAQWRAAQSPFMFGRNPPKTDEIYKKLEAMVKKNGDYDSVIALERAVRKRMETQKFWKPGTKYVENPTTPK